MVDRLFCLISFRVFCSLRDDNYVIASEICRNLGVIFGECSSSISFFQDRGLISVERHGRMKLIRLTSKGLRLYRLCKVLEKDFVKADSLF